MSGDTEEVEDKGGVGAEGGEDENAETLPFAPGEGDDSPLGDTDQHSQASSGHDQPKK